MKKQITKWFCERNQIKKEELDKYHRYAIATTFKYVQEQVKNVNNRREQYRREQWRCVDCGGYIDPFDAYCKHCGQVIP